MRLRQETSVQESLDCCSSDKKGFISSISVIRGLTSYPSEKNDPSPTPISQGKLKASGTKERDISEISSQFQCLSLSDSQKYPVATSNLPKRN